MQVSATPSITTGTINASLMLTKISKQEKVPPKQDFFVSLREIV